MSATTRIIDISNRKGGVAKTTAASNLAAGLALGGHRVLLVDGDDQTNLTQAVAAAPTEGTILEYIYGGPLPVLATRVPNLDVVPGSLDLVNLETDLLGQMLGDPEARQQAGGITDQERREALKAVFDHVAERLGAIASEPGCAYDYVIIDTPPALNAITLSAMKVADTIVVPAQVNFFAFAGTRQTVDFARKVNPAATLRILRTHFDRTNAARDASQTIEEAFGELVLATLIKRTVRFDEATYAGEPLISLDPTSDGARNYAAAVEELFGVVVGAGGVAAAAAS